MFGHVFSWPKFPLTNYGDAQQRTLWINALALFVGLYGFVKCLIIAYQWLINNRIIEEYLEILSFAYVALLALTILFFCPSMDERTLCIGINRYVFVSPFFFIILSSEFKKFSMNVWWKWSILVISANCCWLAFGSYIHLQELLFYNMNTLIIAAYVLYFKRGGNTNIGYLIFGFNLLIQIMCFQQFITPLYPD